MTGSTRRTAAVLGGAVALAAAAYSIGSQAGDGSAAAARSESSNVSSTAPAHFRGGGPGEGLSALAEDLGVSEDKLRTALDDLRDEQPRDAFEATRPRRGAAPGRFRGRRAPERALASELGVSVAKLRAAVRAVRPDRGDRHERGDMSEALAKELGVDAAKVEDAFEQLREKHEAEHESREADFAAALAEKLGVSEDKVADALAAKRPVHGRGGGHRGHGRGPGLGRGGPPPGGP
jgi:hypothetical protein